MQNAFINSIDLSTLTDMGKKEIIDFYEYLLTKYAKKEQKEQKNTDGRNFEKFLSHCYKVDDLNLPSREELHER